MISEAPRRLASLAVTLCLVAGACGGSDGDTDEREREPVEFATADQDVTEVDPPADAVVASTSTTTTTTSTTTTTTTTTQPPPVVDDPPATGTGRTSGNEVAFASGGTETVGTDINAGLYIAQAGTDFCTWDRVTPSGDSEGSIGQGQVIVEILASDESFTSDPDCGIWEPYVAPSEPATTIGEGHWVVGDQIVPGRYRTDQTEFEFCYWERSTAFTHTTEEIIFNAIVMEQDEVVIQADDARFVTSGCGTWTLID